MPSEEALAVIGVLAGIVLLGYLSHLQQSGSSAAPRSTASDATPERTSEILVQSVAALSVGLMHDIEKALLLIHPTHPVNREYLRLHIIAASTAIGLQPLGEAYGSRDIALLIAGARNALSSLDARAPRIFGEYVGLVPVGEGSDKTPHIVAELFARNMLARITADPTHVNRIVVLLFGYLQSLAIQGVDRSFSAIRASLQR